MAGIIAGRRGGGCHTPDGHRVNCAAIAALIALPRPGDVREHPHGMERLAETIVAWHNRHPLARRIRVQDVHTIGVVSLPFLRSEPPPQEPTEPQLTPPAALPSAAPVDDTSPAGTEPVLTEAVDPAQLQARADTSAGDGAVDAAAPSPAAAESSYAASASVWSSTPPGGGSSLRQRLAGRQPAAAASVPGSRPAFNERFVPRLSVRRVAAFALAHGFSTPPGTQEAMPWRVVSPHKGAGEGWPYEIYLLSAGIDVGTSRRRVLAGCGMPAPILGRRLLDPRKLAAAALTALALAGAAGYGLWAMRTSATPVQAPPAVAASAASAPSADSAPSAPASAATPAPDAASAVAAEVASAADAASSASAAEMPLEAPDAEEPRDIRPHLIPELGRRDGKPRPPLQRSEAAASAAAATAGATTAVTPGTPSDARPDSRPQDASAERPMPSGKASPALRSSGSTADRATDAAPAQPGNKLGSAVPAPRSVVALVGPAGSKAEAEASLKSMRNALAGLHSDPNSLQAMVIETPQGWRATVWPFNSREQAQLINAVLVARGLRTKAIDF